MPRFLVLLLDPKTLFPERRGGNAVHGRKAQSIDEFDRFGLLIVHYFMDAMCANNGRVHRFGIHIIVNEVGQDKRRMMMIMVMMMVSANARQCAVLV